MELEHRRNLTALATLIQQFIDRKRNASKHKGYPER